MKQLVTIHRAESKTVHEAFMLLSRFFAEEGFATSGDELHTNLTRMLGDDSTAVFMAWAGAQAVGAATVSYGNDLEHGLNAELEDLYVVPEFCRTGVASLLINSVRAWCTAKGCTTLWIVVTAEGQAKHNLLSFYEKMGFSNSRRIILEQSLVH